MYRNSVMAMLCMGVGMLVPNLLMAQTGGGIAGEMKSLQEVLARLYDEMIPLCSKLIGVGKGIAGFAATFYIAARIWRHIASAEPIDFYPLFRPFVLGFAIINFTMVVRLIRGILEPTVSGTQSMVTNSDQAVAQLLKMKEDAIKKTDAWQMYIGTEGGGNYDKWYKYTYGDEEEGFLDGISNSVKFALAKASYSFRNSIKEWMSTVLQILFQAAALCINTIRTFYLIVLAILGPLVFGLAVFDGFQHTLTVWLARYINTFLWLPIANIFGAIIGKIQENMLKVDLSQIGQNGDTFFTATDAAYLVFMVIGIVGYFTVPSVANYVVHAGGGNGLLARVTNVSMMSGSTVANMTGGNATAMISDVYGDMRSKMQQGFQGGSADYFKDKLSGK